MVENRPWLTVFSHTVLILGIIVVAFPLYVTFVASTLTLDQILTVPMPLIPGDQLWNNYSQVLGAGSTRGSGAPVSTMLMNSLIMALGIAIGKISISIIASFAIVYFRFPGRNFFFWMIFVTLMLPVEVRIIPTFKVVADLGMLDSYQGLTLPLIASATATFLFRQFFLTIPEELAEAARIDGAGPWRQMLEIGLPNIGGAVAAMAVLSFLGAWNLYLWPHLILDATEHKTLSIGLKLFATTGEQGGQWGPLMATALLAALPVVALYLVAQRQLISAFTTSGVR